MTRLRVSEAGALAGAHFVAGRFDECRAVVDAILAAEPACVSAWQLRGLLAHRQGRIDEAIAALGRAVALDPRKADLYDNLCVCLCAQRRYDEAQAAARTALALSPDFAAAASNLGNVLRALRRPDDAEAAYRRAITMAPDQIEAYVNLSALLADRQRFDEAVPVAQAALERDPRRIDARLNLAGALNQLGRLAQAEAVYREALGIDPRSGPVWQDLAVTLLHGGRVDEALAAQRQAVELPPQSASAHSGWLLALQYRPGITPDELRQAHAEWDRRHARPFYDSSARRLTDPRSDRCGPSSDRPLRVGFVSADFGQHPVGCFLVRLLEHVDRCEIVPVCYCDRVRGGDLARRLRAASEWVEIEHSSDEELAARIRADRIDVLVDLAGHTPRNRLLVFARKPAPLQIAWIGYPGTTGLAAIDYLLADRHQVPEQAEPFYVERILRMPDGYVCYDPPPDAPEVTRLPAITNGYVTFGSFNNLAKIQAPVIELWAEILRCLPDARLILQYNGFDDPATRHRYAQAFGRAGVASDRIAMFGFSQPKQVLLRYQEVDLALDTFPYSGGLTTCEALWMGVPVITCPGSTFAGRHTLTHLAAVGLGELVAGDPRHYVRLATELAGDPDRLASLRAGLRNRMTASPLCDGPRFARHFADVLRHAWNARSATR